MDDNSINSSIPTIQISMYGIHHTCPDVTNSLVSYPNIF